MNVELSDGIESVRALIIFPLAHDWKQFLLVHGCSFGENEYGETVIFPEVTTRTLLLSRTGRGTNCFRILFPDGLELREVLDDEGTGKSWLLLVLSQEQMQGARTRSDLLQNDERRNVMDERNEQEARAIIEKACARVGLITVLTRRLEGSDDLLAKIAAAELREDHNWLAFTKGLGWYTRGRRKIARRKR